MTQPHKILIIENEISAARILRNHLCMNFSSVSVAFDSASALKDLSSHQIDFVILGGASLHDVSGLSFIREIRRTSDVPIIYYGDKGHSAEKVRLLESGADDYMCRPLDLKELTARIHAIWRRYQTIPPGQTSKASDKSVAYPQLSINLTNYSVICDDQSVDMPPKELELLYFLAASPNQVFTREQLLNQIWGYDYLGDPRTVDVHIKRIREKIKDHDAWSLDTVWAVGYKFSLHSSYTSSDGLSAPSV
ncbi:MAG: response regulator transcription factor [Eubacteriales bacterium]|nr:response regulator transcription factor [Eubacteriales bacterium]